MHRPVLTLLLALAVVVTACGSDAPTAEPGPRRPTEGPAAATAEPRNRRTSLRPGAGLLLGVPVYDGDFADPFVLRVGRRNYAYATNTASANVPLIESGDGPLGTYRGDVLPDLPSWSVPGAVWAPSVARVGGRYVLHYATTVAATGRQCVSSAVADSPRGPFVDDSTGPLVCQDDLGGTIDPSVFTDSDGAQWLLYKNDGNCCGLATSLWSSRLGPDGRSVVGPPHRLLTARSDTWEGGLVEGPSMVQARGTYWLFYSANAWDSEAYGIGVAACRSPAGPCRRRSVDEPWMGSTTFARGPGGQEFFRAGGQVWMVYHGWPRDELATRAGQRRLFLDIVEFGPDGPVRVGGRTAAALLVIVVAALALVLAGTVLAVRRRRARRAPTAPPT